MHRLISGFLIRFWHFLHFLDGLWVFFTNLHLLFAYIIHLIRYLTINSFLTNLSHRHWLNLNSFLRFIEINGIPLFHRAFSITATLAVVLHAFSLSNFVFYTSDDMCAANNLIKINSLRLFQRLFAFRTHIIIWWAAALRHRWGRLFGWLVFSTLFEKLVDAF